mgnify:CR=1 FL=1
MDYMDDFQITTETQKVFNDLLTEATVKNAAWEKYSMGDIRFLSVKEVEPAKIEDFTSLGVYGDTSEHTQLYASLEGGKPVAIGESALLSIFGRAKIAGTALSHLDSTFLADLLNQCFQLWPGMLVLVYKSMLKIRAMHSNQYKPISVPAVFQAARKTFEEQFEHYQWLYGYVDHAQYIAEYEIKDDFLLDQYRTLLGVEDLTANVKVVTSNTARNGINVYYNIVNRSSGLTILGNRYLMDHRRKDSLEAFKENISQTYTQYQGAYQSMDRLASIIFLHPDNVLYEALASINIPKKWISEVVSLHQSIAGKKSNTALSVFLSACEVLGIAAREGYGQKQLQGLSEKVYRLKLTDLSKFDYRSKEEILAA